MPTKPATQAMEDLHACLRLAQLEASQAHDRQQDGQRWFSRFLQRLEGSGVELIERTTKSINCVPTDAVFQEVFSGWIPAPQRRNLGFERVAKEILHGLQQPDLALLRSTSASSHLRLEFDVDDSGSPVAIIFNLCCSTDPDAPRTRLVLQLDHLGARLDARAFETRREQVENRLQALCDLDQL